MPAPPDDARCTLAEVRSLEPCGEDAVILRVRPDEDPGEVRASRFYMLKRTDTLSPLIPRPFSLYLQEEGDLSFLVKVMGRGTRALAELRPGEQLQLVGPLGNGWPALDGDGDPWVLVAGGVGSAPFPMAIAQAARGMDGCEPNAPERTHLIFGAARAGLLYDLDRFRELGVNVHAATDDGSEGFRGNVVGLLESLWSSGALPERVRILCCGPDPMMAAVERVARERDLACWFSLEELMGCGVGICNGCPVPTLEDGPRGDWPNAKCCVEGPVFGIEEISLAGHG
jgi:dihydroorotate dehydrogenase electron transfer subunit